MIGFWARRLPPTTFLESRVVSFLIDGASKKVEDGTSAGTIDFRR